MRKNQRVLTLSREVFTHHVLTTEGLHRWRCGRPGDSMYSFRVIALPGVVIIYGDLGERIYRHAGHNSLEWLRGAVQSPEYLLGKASPQFKLELEDEDDLRAEIAQWVGEPGWAACLGLTFRMIGRYAQALVDEVPPPEECRLLMVSIVDEEMAEFGGEELDRRRVVAKKVWNAFEDQCDSWTDDHRQAWATAWYEQADREPPFGGEIYEAQAFWHAEALRVFVALLTQREAAQNTATPDVQHMAVLARETVETLLTRAGI
jgi:hypothetical protein